MLPPVLSRALADPVVAGDSAGPAAAAALPDRVAEAVVQDLPPVAGAAAGEEDNRAKRRSDLKINKKPRISVTAYRGFFIFGGLS